MNHVHVCTTYCPCSKPATPDSDYCSQQCRERSNARVRLRMHNLIDPNRDYRVEFGGLDLAQCMSGYGLRNLVWTVTDPRRLTFQVTPDEPASLVERSLRRLTA